MKLYTIHKEMLKELALTFLLSLVALNFILIMEKILRLSRLLSIVGASFFDMLKITTYLQPPVLLLTLPMSLLMSTLLTYGRLNADNELIILKASGMSFKMISRPVFYLGIACFLVGIFVSFYLGPLSMTRLRETVSAVISQRAPFAIEEGVFTTLFKDTILFVNKKPASGVMREIFIYDNRNKEEPRILLAKEGKIAATDGGNISFYLNDGYMHIAKDEISTEIFFKGYNLSLNLAADQPSIKNSELSPLKLLDSAKTRTKKESISMYLEFHRRLSLPAVCLLLMLIGPPLAMLAGKTGRLGGLSIGLLVFVVFYILLIYGENLARTGKIPHYIGAWSPTLLLSIFSLWILRREGNK